MKTNNSTIAFGLSLVWSAASLFGQQPFPTQQLTAVAVLQQVHSTNLQGGALPTDVTLTGVMTDETGKTEPYMVRIKGTNKIRYDIGFGDSQRVTVYNANQGWTLVNKKLKALQESTSVRRPTLIPALDLLNEYANPRLVTTDGGTGAIGPQIVRHLSLFLPDAAKSRPFGRKLDESEDVYFDPATNLVVRTQHFNRVEENMDVQVPSTLDFSDYRLIGNVAIPFHIVNTTGSATLGGTHQKTVVFNQAQINANIPDSVFSAAAVKP